MKAPLRLALLALALVACGTDDVPTAPTWFADVGPIVVANCGRCHGGRPADPRLADVRLDRYVAGDDASLDAWDYRDAIVQQAVDGVAPMMPPTYDLDERQRTTLARWLANGAPKGERPNQAPSAALLDAALPATVDQSLPVAIRVTDPDGDGLAVALAVRPVGGGELTLVAAGLPGGQSEVVVDTGQLASGQAVELVALADDGWSDDPAANVHVLPLGAPIAIDHGARGTAPRVTLLAPNGGETILGTTAITWSATDPDVGDVLRATLELIRVSADGSEAVAATLATDLVDVSTWTWDPAGVPIADGATPITYRVRVTVTDGQNPRADASDGTFTIAPPSTPTALTWADVKPVFVTYCRACHGQPARTAALESFRLDKYDAGDPEPPANGDLGVYEMRSAVFTRLVTQGSMPPASAPQPSAADVDKVRAWILGGAPRDGGGGDGPPSLVWTAPNDTTITTATGGAVTLIWTASDPEGLPLTGAIAFARINATADQTARCDATVTGWTDLPVAIDAGSYAWTLPATGYFCLRGTVTDAAAQTVVRIAARPVKYRTTPGP